MTVNDEVDKLTKEERLLEVAKLAVARYPLAVEDVHFVVEETNRFYQVTTKSKQRYALKIFDDDSSTLQDNRLEAFFLQALREVSDIAVPEVITAEDGSAIQTIDSDYTPDTKRVAVYSWIDGQDLAGNECKENLQELGRLTALLHQAASKLRVPANLTPRRWDRVFYYQDERAVYKQDKYQRFLSKEYHYLMDGIIPFLDEALASYYAPPMKPHLIHGDLNPWNVKVCGNQLWLLDFEDVISASPLHDLAIMLYYYTYDEDFNYPEVRETVLKGYQEVLPLPNFSDYDLDLLMTARRVNFLNFILLVSEDPQDFIQASIPRVRDFLNRYRIKL